MKRLSGLALGLLLAACGPSSSQRALSGQLDTTQVSLVGAQVIAQSRDGRLFRAPVSATGAFRLALPTGTQYVVRFANATSNASRFDSFAVLAVRPGQHVFTWSAGPDVALGRVGIGAAASSLMTMSTEPADAEAGSADSEAEDGAIEDDEAEACDLSGGQDEIEVETQHDLLAEVDSDHDGVDDADDAEDDRVACASASGDDDCELDDAEEKELEDEHEAACSSGAGGANPAPVPGVAVP